MLDETTCPVCGKEVDETDWLDDPVPTYAEMTRTNAVWAVAHYLAHLVQQKVETEREQTRIAAIQAAMSERVFSGVDKPNPKGG